MARLYADEDFPLPIVELLRQMGHDVLTVAEQTCKRQMTTSWLLRPLKSAPCSR